MRKNYLICLLLAACGPEVGTTGDSSGASSTGDGTTTATPTTGDATTTSPTTTGDGTTTAASTTGDTTEIDLTTGDTCLEHEILDPGDWPEELVLGCQLPEICPGEEELDFDPFGDDGWSADDIDRARCMATAMRDRTPGKLLYRETEDESDIGNHFVIEIHGAQVSLRRTEIGLGFGYDYKERVTFLREPAFFADCAGGTATQVHECLEQGFTDECATQLECPR